MTMKLKPSPDAYYEPPTQSQRGGRESRRRDGRGDARGTAAERHILGVSTTYMGSFQM